MSDRFESGRAFLDEYAKKNGLRRVGGYGSLRQMILEQFYDARELNRRKALMEHVECFAAKGRRRAGQPEVVLAISFLYVEDTPQLRADAEAFAVRFGLNCRVNHPNDRVYNAESYTPVAFWRDDYYELR